MDSESSPSYPTANHVRVHPHPPHAPQQQHQQHQHPHNGAMTPMAAQQQQQQIFLPAQPLGMNGNSNVTMSGGGMNGGGLLYNNLIPGHYRYGAKPPAPPPGPLSYSNTSSHPPQHSIQGSSQQYQNVPPATGSQVMNQSSECYLQVTEPDDEWDDVAISPDEDDDDEQYYRPFRHASAGSGASAKNGKNGSSMNPSSSKKNGKMTYPPGEKSSGNNARTVTEETKPVDMLAVLLGGPARQQETSDSGNDNMGDIAILMEEAAAKSQRARSMTNTLAAKTNSDDGKAKKGDSRGEVDSDLYVATANAHTEAALAYQKVYRRLLGLEINDDAANDNVRKRTVVKGASPSPSEELAKSMLILAHTHARMAKSLGTMGAKWNMGKVDVGGRMVSKDATATAADNAKTTDKKTAKDEKKDDQSIKSAAAKPTTNNASSNGDAFKDDETSPGALQHERLRMAVRGALDTAHHEEDITNSTFLARSTVLNAANNQRQGASKAAPSKSRNRLAGLGLALGNAAGCGKTNGEGGVNPVDDLMKLEKELQCMDMALEMGNSVASLGGATTAAASFCVVPPGKSSYMTSSSMWASGILGGIGGGGNSQQQQKQQQNQQHPVKQQVRPGLQQGMAGVRSRANHLQSFLGGNRQQPASAQPRPPAKTAAAPSPSQQPQQGVQITPGNAALDQSWWGGGQGSVLASSAIAAVSSNGQRSPTSNPSGPDAQGGDANSAARQQQTSTNAKQLMQLMDSLNRLGNENAQLMREVEDARAARAEAKAAKDLMAKFKAEYGQKFGKVKEALKRYPGPQQGGTPGSGGAVDPVSDSAYVKQASALEIQKRDRTIRQLSADLKRERDECKKKDGALQKYEAFYREVKARSAEKARQRQLQEKRAGGPKAERRQQQPRP